MRNAIATAFFALLCAMNAFSQKPFDMPLYGGEPEVKSTDALDEAHIYVYPATKGPSPKRAVLVCPGGGYSHLAMDHEGKQWAAFFQRLGITTVVLKYRMPRGNCEVPFSDALNALRLIRSKAKEWNINPDDVGIMGSSAGGHLASYTACNTKGADIPAFEILFYPVITMMKDLTHQGSHDCLIGKDAKKKQEMAMSNDMHVSRNTPRAIIFVADDDHVVSPINSVSYYNELYRNDVPASLHVYPSGGHGFGIRDSFEFHEEMLQSLKSWLMGF